MLVWCIVRLEWPWPVAQAKALLTNRRPTEYSHKVRYKMARDRRPIMTTWADKLAVRGYVTEKIGTDALLDVYSTARAGRDLDWDALPREYVLKVNHGCGGMIIVTESADPDYRLPHPGPRTRWSRHMIHPDATDREAMIALLDSWLALRYGWGLGSHWEWMYQDIVRTAYAEEYVGVMGPARNLKIHCINGEPKVVSVTRLAQDLHGDIPEGRFLVDRAPTEVEVYGLSREEWHRAEQWSRALASETDFVRVDWLITDRGPIFGEFTSYPAAGRVAVMGATGISGPDLATWLSDQWTVPRHYA